jgi:hypothetical protein
LLLAAFTGCGGDGDDDTNTGATTPTTDQRPAA